MTQTSFTVHYTKARAVPPASAIAYEKSFPTMDMALDFCVRLSGFSGHAIDVVQLIRGVEDAVLEGDCLNRAIARRKSLPRAA
jgi:hypothetical protein